MTVGITSENFKQEVQWTLTFSLMTTVYMYYQTIKQIAHHMFPEISKVTLQWLTCPRSTGDVFYQTINQMQSPTFVDNSGRSFGK